MPLNEWNEPLQFTAALKCLIIKTCVLKGSAYKLNTRCFIIPWNDSKFVLISDSTSSSKVEDFSMDQAAAGPSVNKEENRLDTSSHDVETVYKQAVNFLELTEQLIDAPEALRHQCKKLLSAKKELSRAIENLKQQSESVRSQ